MWNYLLFYVFAPLEPFQLMVYVMELKKCQTEVKKMKDIKGYEGHYAITSCGKVWSYKSKKFLKIRKQRNGYLYVFLSKDGIEKWFSIHHLVADAYIPNPENKPEVDHIDRDKSHNYVGNLRWVSHSENQTNRSNGKIICPETGEIFESQKDAAEKLNLSRSFISLVVNGKRKMANGNHLQKYEVI